MLPIGPAVSCASGRLLGRFTRFSSFFVSNGGSVCHLCLHSPPHTTWRSELSSYTPIRYPQSESTSVCHATSKFWTSRSGRLRQHNERNSQEEHQLLVESSSRALLLRTHPNTNKRQQDKHLSPAMLLSSGHLLWP